jgi:hypothetical protein
MKVRMSEQKSIAKIARLEALLAGLILTVSTAYAATVCPMYWTQLQLDADLRNRLAITDAVECWYLENGDWPREDLRDVASSSPHLQGVGLICPLNGEPYRLDPVTHRVQ